MILSKQEIKQMRHDANICNTDLSIALDAYEALQVSHAALVRVVTRIAVAPAALDADMLKTIANDALAALDRRGLSETS